MRERNTTGNYSLEHLQKVLEEALQEVTSEDAQGFLRHVIKLEEEYLDKDPKIDVRVDEMIIELGGANDSGDSDDGFDFSDEDEENHDDSDLAVPCLCVFLVLCYYVFVQSSNFCIYKDKIQLTVKETV